MRKFLKRRTFLRGATIGGVATVALPKLDAMLNLEQTAFADGSTDAVRYLSWFMGNGFVLDRFEPVGTGESWQLNAHMQPLAGVKDYLNVVTGLTNRSKETITHHEGMTVFNGYTMVDIGQGQGFFSNPGGPTLDHLISEALAGQTPISGIHLGVSKAQSPADYGWTMHALSHRGYLQPNEPITSPSAAWQSLFGNLMQDKDDRELRLSILDSIKPEVDTLKSELGPQDNMRLEAHLESIAALEAKLAVAAPLCELPMDPMFENSEPINNEQLTLVNELMSDLMAYAFSCDLTRVATLMFLEGAAEPQLGEVQGAQGSWHNASHNTNTWAVGNYYDNGQIYMMERFGYLLEKLRDTPDFDGNNLLDNTIALMSSDASDGSVHAITRQPMLLAGSGRGYLKYPGIHYQPAPLSGSYNYGQWPTPSSGNCSDVLLSILQAFDPTATWVGEEPDQWGEGAGSGTPLPDILA
ncbi:Tat (twin-arginine translocation) pathway signal sequence domain protein [Plesiocystis pacifica SIR-1]|uniref:Tat (Twin-arginine translocation) pathway signal sequence domain protein n=1 Tax=Plesiocystis pacifica SIR-1 TaxID=391625 RepID=A6FXB8_9BACT|nr:DUF1552 domain-containing protein [Plesiocystis pacifica]EDM81942.1 Tat (twin-arginine translocation) pathway signal sequence domain protein [Plesiocystis pacifica SIR-1]